MFYRFEIDMLLTIHVTPNAKRNELQWLDKDTVKIKVAASATEGKANKALIDFLSEHFDLPRSQIRLVRGATARIKQVDVPF